MQAGAGGAAGAAIKRSCLWYNSCSMAPFVCLATASFVYRLSFLLFIIESNDSRLENPIESAS